MRRKTPCLLLPLLAVLAACGGSGSSGFSVSPLEEAAITEVLDTGRCSEVESLEICPASDSLGQIPGQPSDGPVVGEGSHVVFNLPPDDALSCALVPTGSGDCTLLLSFSASGQATNSVYQVAVRQVEPELGPWIVGDEVSHEPFFQTSVEVPSGAAAVQIAVLVFDDAGTQAGSVEALSYTGAAVAFVSDALQVGPAVPAVSGSRSARRGD